MDLRQIYKFFWPELKHFAYRSFCRGPETGKLSVFQNRGIITCIPKEGKDRKFIKHWRPITLLNTDDKILTSATTNRLKKHLPCIIRDSQTGFQPGKFIDENTRWLYDTLHLCENESLSDLLLLLDFEKAFDSIEWAFIDASLHCYSPPWLVCCLG
ncbi:MAG: hypothetical protein DSZ28_00495 [Thiothrix sp.]|nr:MAG: hypothetical protein DSZ28_00495 [Thiothrix sp.]